MSVRLAEAADVVFIRLVLLLDEDRPVGSAVEWCWCG
jgi:hypothetical protein